MSLTPVILYQANSRTSANPTGKPLRKYPLPKQCPIQLAAYAFDLEFDQLLSSFPPGQKNTPSNAAAFGFAALGDARAILTAYSQPAGEMAGMGKYKATFSVVPASWDDYQTMNVSFPAWKTNTFNFRPLKPRLVTCRMRYDYFVVDPTGLAAGVLDSGGNAISSVTDKSKIPTLERSYFVNCDGSQNPLPNCEVQTITPLGGTGTYQQTLPTIQQYTAWCAIATTFLGGSATWDATHPPLWNGASQTDVTSGQWRFENSKIVDYAGNIISRVTPHALFE